MNNAQLSRINTAKEHFRTVTENAQNLLFAFYKSRKNSQSQADYAKLDFLKASMDEARHNLAAITAEVQRDLAAKRKKEALKKYFDLTRT